MIKTMTMIIIMVMTIVKKIVATEKTLARYKSGIYNKIRKLRFIVFIFEREDS